MPDGRFRGWPSRALEFYAGLEADNSKAYWLAHRDVYDRDVRGPTVALLEELAPTYGEFHLFRPNRDVRFSKDKSPYKTAIAAVTEGEGGEHYYVQFSAEGLFVGVGLYHMAADQLARYREAVDDERTGSALRRIVDSLTAKGFTIGGEQLKTAPRGYPRDHPRVALLRHKGMYAGRSHAPAAWLSTRACISRITKAWEGAAPLNSWLGRHVGPSTEPPWDAR
jgi:uncharacterized protein (TIGR02453 family)